MSHWRWLVVALALVGGLGRALAAQAPLTTRLSTLQNPRGITWHELSTDHFTVIYPDSLAAEARRAAGLLESFHGPLGTSLGARPKRIPVVLNNTSLITNAYVGWAPRRSQWYAMPNTTVDAFGPVEWYRLLAAHEGRHIVQEQALRTGWVGLLARLFGDNTMAFLGGSLYFPAWFWEGDAVGMETALTGSGRGRLPQFTARSRALLAAEGPYDYYAAWQGSLRTVYPDWYELGFLLTSHVRRHYGDSAWRRVVQRAAWNPLPPFALSAALKRETGHTLLQLHRAALLEADSAWRVQREGRPSSPVTPVSRPANGYHVWSLPQYAADGSVIATYWDLDTPTQLVRLRAGEREVLVDRIGAVGDLQFHVRGTTVVWSEYEVDPRYGERNYLVVKALDLTTGRVRRLSDRSRYASPVLSPDARLVAVVEFDRSRRSRLVLLDAQTGRVEGVVDAATPPTIMTPAWTADGRGLLVVGIDSVRGNALVRVDVASGATRTLVDYTQEAISRPVATGGHVVFGSPRDGLDNAWAVDTTTLAQVRLTSRPFGAAFPSPSADGRTMLFVDQGPGGWDVVEAPLDVARGTPEADVVPEPVRLADSTVAQEARLTGPIVPVSITAEPRPYRGVRTLFDLHSLSLAPGSDGVNQGVSIESRNLLNTVGVNAGVLWNTNEQRGSVDLGVSYAGLPVLVDAGVRLGSRGSTYTDTTGREVGYSWRERSVQVLARLPLTRLIGQRRQSITFSAGVAPTRITGQPVRFRFDNGNGSFVPVVWGMTASHVRSAGFRDLFQTGASAAVTYRHTPLDSDYRSHLLAVRGTGIAAGPLRNDALVLDAGHEEQRPDNYRFSSELTFARGFSRRYHDRLTRVGATYHVPLLYPDLAVGPLLFVRRIQGAAFVDLARGADASGSRRVDYRSAGAEFTADVAPLGMRSTMRVGVRLSQRLTGDKRAVAQFILALP